MDENHCDEKGERTPRDVVSEVIPRAVVCCPLCGEEFRQPKILPCLHSYCQQCLQGYLAHATNTESRDNIRCPECNTDVFADSYDISNLSDNFFVRRLLDPIKTQQKNDKQCRQCSGTLSGTNDSKSAGFYCVNCEEHLCASCTQSHQEENETSSHKVEPMEPIKGDNPRQTLPPTNGTSSLPQCCKYYDPLDVGSLFCVNCDILTCSECCVKSHSSHRCAELNAVAMNFENRVDEPLLDLEDSAHQLSENLTTMTQARDDLLAKQKKLWDCVVRRKEFLVEMIESYAQTVIAEVDRQVEQKLAKVEQERVNTKYHISSINAVLNFTDNLLAYGTDEEKVSQRKKIGGRIRELSEMEIKDEVLLPTDLDFTQPEVTVETICEMFGELIGAASSSTLRQEQRNHPCTSNQTSIDSGHFSEVNGEMTDLGASLDGRRSSLSSLPEKPDRVRRKSVQFDNHVTQARYETDHIFHLDDFIRKFPIPSGIERDCIKGMGINNNGDIIIGAVHTQGQCIYIVEKRGIIRGKVPVEGWQIHSVASDGKVSMIVTRGNNRYKVRVLSEDCNRPLVDECHIQCYGFNFVTANSLSQVIIAANRYGKVCGTMGKAAKSGGNIAIYDKRGHLLHRFTNENYQDFNLYVLERPCCVAVDKAGNIYVADAGSHLVAGFSSSGDLLFTFGNSDTNDDEIYEGPDSVALDYCGNLIVTDKKANRIDILTVRGQLKKTLYTSDTPKFVSAGLDKQIMVTSPEGLIQFYEYMHL
ncbi:tripartite motif-containing protein 2-like [Liolophura sinensis]|uniref:tripartite motif-containing protein 2-like n=1 Tax=Liolophura sinensis TaxID=3198878 RepID=UPI003158292D